MSSSLIGNNIIRLNTVDSTNNYAAKLLNQTNIPFGTVIMSRFQSSGKGQRSSNWISSDDENLLFSIILDTSFLKPSNIFYLSKVVSVSLKMALSEIISNNVSIKWPNDIFVDSLKIAGILIENQWAANKLKSSIIGIGLNVNQTDFNTSFSPTSLSMLTKTEHSIDDVLQLVIKYLKIYFEYLKQDRLSIIDKPYLDYLFRYNQWFNYKSSNSKFFSGKIIGVNNDGLLIIEKKNGNRDSYDLKEISFIL